MIVKGRPFKAIANKKSNSGSFKQLRTHYPIVSHMFVTIYVRLIKRSIKNLLEYNYQLAFCYFQFYQNEIL